MLALPSNSPRNKNFRYLINEKTTPIQVITAVDSIAQYNDSNELSSSFLLHLDRCYEILFYRIKTFLGAEASERVVEYLQ